MILGYFAYLYWGRKSDKRDDKAQKK